MLEGAGQLYCVHLKEKMVRKLKHCNISVFNKWYAVFDFLLHTFVWYFQGELLPDKHRLPL
jgi:hypothetical protein